MRKNSITRFDSENIAFIDFDTDTKEGVAGIIDEVNGQDYPFSGGGVQFFIEPEILTQTAETTVPGVELNASGSVDVSAIMLKLDGEEPLYIPLLQDSPSHYIVDDFFSGEYGIYVELTKIVDHWHIFIGEDDTTPTVMTAEISAVGEW